VAHSGDVPSVRHGALSAIHNDRLYVFGGATAKNKALDDMYSFEFASGTWTRITASDGPSKRYFAASLIVGDRLFVHGGEVNIKTQVADFYEYSFTNNKWRRIEIGGETPVKERAGECESCAIVHPTLRQDMYYLQILITRRYLFTVDLLVMSIDHCNRSLCDRLSHGERRGWL
jgi:N-acetylneuraminic acid mutarotase